MQAFEKLAIRCRKWPHSWKDCVPPSVTRPSTRRLGAANLERRRFTPAKMAARSAPRARRTRMRGASTLTYRTGIIVPVAMADASAREYAAQSGSNE
ncbi:hypothetical protein SBC1_26560 [Caballeronia sp. SBC1]|nr:hypothetical protein SBC1_26560 [Caballeronia sp. SBC1]